MLGVVTKHTNDRESRFKHTPLCVFTKRGGKMKKMFDFNPLKTKYILQGFPFHCLLLAGILQR